MHLEKTTLHTLPAEHHNKPISQLDYTYLMEGAGGHYHHPGMGRLQRSRGSCDAGRKGRVLGA